MFTREQEKEINSLKSQRQLLRTENEALREQLQDKAQTSSGNTHGANSLDSTLRKLELQYQQTLEKGMYVVNISWTMYDVLF